MNENFINEEIFERIYKNFNLEEFSSSYETLSLRNISEMAKFQSNLTFLKISWCRISYDRIDSTISFSKVSPLKLIYCALKPKVMESIAKLLWNSKLIALSNYKVICECDQQIDDNYMYWMTPEIRWFIIANDDKSIVTIILRLGDLIN